MPDGCFLVGYADDIAVIITGRTIQEIQWKLNLIMKKHGWHCKLKLALDKTEMVLLTHTYHPQDEDIRRNGNDCTRGQVSRNNHR